MAASNSGIHTHLCQSKLLFSSLSVFYFSFFVLFAFAASLSFDFTSFDPSNGSLNFEGGAHLVEGAIQLTLNKRDKAMNGSSGRATYMESFHLWDKNSRYLANFTTRFSFMIASNNTNNGDGLAFFLADANGSPIPDKTAGGGLGLGPVSNNEALNSTDYPFVAVEFDTFSNPWDPSNTLVGLSDTHIGIDINSVNSVTCTVLNAYDSYGKQLDMLINYDAGLHILSVVFESYRVQQTIDLRHHLPELVTLGFSAATGASTEIHYISSWSFSSSSQTSVHKGRHTDPEGSKIFGEVGLIFGGCVMVLVLVLLSVYLWGKIKKWTTRNCGNDHLVFDVVMNDGIEIGMGPKKFSYHELSRATKNFAEGEKLGEGGFGGVYRGFLRYSKSYVAIKRFSRDSRQGMKEFASEVKVISRLRHRNLVKLLGWCNERRELLLVYEFMPNGSLDILLFKEGNVLPWTLRFRIAQGLALALLYLHEECEKCVVHRDVKPSNVLLDSNFNAKLGDFGLARFVDHEKGSQTTDLAGTIGYLAPECVTTGKARRESDVYSFGIVALEIACGRKLIHPTAKENQIVLVEWVWDLYGGEKILEAADPKLCEAFDEGELGRLMIVGLWCAHPDSSFRPSIRQAIHVLNSEAPLPILPSKMPVPTYFSSPAPTVATSSSSICLSTFMGSNSSH